MSVDLFQLLPAVYRMRDAQIARSLPLLTPVQQTLLDELQALPQPLPADQQAQLDELQTLASRGPLESMLMVVSEQLTAVAYDLDRLYDDEFIETCAPWVIPYIGDLIGYQQVTGIAPAVDNPRAEVAETISLRRRKGTILVIEQLARDVTGWGAHAVEEFQVLADTQYMKHIRPHNFYAPNLRHWRSCTYMDTGFDETAHKVDVHKIATGLGQYNIQNVAIFLWSLSAAGITSAPLTAATTNTADNQLCYRFNALGLDVPLFHRALSQGEQITAAAAPANVPDQLLRRVLCADLTAGVGASYYGQGASLAIYLDQMLLSPYQIAVADLSGADGSWVNQPNGESPFDVVIDPELGRLALSPSLTGHSLSASYFNGVNGNLGGGEYERTLTVTNEAFVVPYPDARFATLQDAIAYALTLLTVNGSVAVEISAESAAQLVSDASNGLESWVSASHLITTTVASPFAIDLPAGATFELRSANLSVQTLLLDAPLQVTGNPDSNFILNGLVLAAQNSFSASATAPALLVVPVARPDGSNNLLSQLTVNDCTLVPGWAYGPAEVVSGEITAQAPTQPRAPVLLVDSASVAVSATTSILGGILANSLATVTLTSCIVDATDPSNTAFAAPDGTLGGAALTLNACTVVGRVHATLLTLVTDSILWSTKSTSVTSGLIADRKQQGCVRFSFLPIDAVTPPPFECVTQAVAAPQPLFVTTRYGQPGYLKLMASTDNSIRRGADDGGEMGVYHFLFAPQRESDLKIRMQEYLPVGLEFGLIYQN
ncbi:MAG: hypothetical protein ABSF70_06110 [Terracidiphilus sp.]|jgi:hypothetical protein